MPRNDGWANLLNAIEYRQNEPLRKIQLEMAKANIEKFRQAQEDERMRKAAYAKIDAVQPEQTITTPDNEANARLLQSSEGLSKYGVQLDPSLQGQATTQKTIPAQQLPEEERLIRKARIEMLSGNVDEAKKIYDMIKIQKEMQQHNPVVWGAFEKAGGNVELTKRILLGMGATPEQVDDIDFSMAGMGALGSKSAGMYLNQKGTMHNKPEDKSKHNTTSAIEADILNKWLSNEPLTDKEQVILDKRIKEKKTERETPAEAAAKTKARLQAKMQSFEQAMGRPLTKGEKRLMFIKDQFGFADEDPLGDDTEPTEMPTPTIPKQPVTKPQPKVGEVKIYKGVKYKFKGGANKIENWVVTNGK